MEVDPRKQRFKPREDAQDDRVAANQDVPPPQDVQIERGERKGALGREPEEPSGPSEAV